jgi:hypothetical protein
MTEDELLLIVRRARVILEDPERWSGHYFAADHAGHWVPVGNDGATRFNLDGALIRAAGDMGREAAAAIKSLFALSCPRLFHRVSSTTQPLTHKEALEVLDAAIERLCAPRSSSSGFRLRKVTPPAAPSLPRNSGSRR